jgi:hypothetical protein
MCHILLKAPVQIKGMPEEIRNLPKKLDNYLKFFSMKKSFFAIFIALLLCIDASAIKITIYGRATEVTTNGPTTTVKCDGFHEEVCMTIELMPGNNGATPLS